MRWETFKSWDLVWLILEVWHFDCELVMPYGIMDLGQHWSGTDVDLIWIAPLRTNFRSESEYKYFILKIINLNTVKCHYNACHYNANASLTRSILGSQTAPTSWHALMTVPEWLKHMGKRCEIIVVWSATAAMTPLCSHTNGIKQTYPTCWSCQYSRFMIDLRSNTLIIHLRCSENATIRPIWLLDARMLKTIPVAIKLT